MKHLTAIALLVLTGCAETKLYDRTTGRPIAKWQSNIAHGEYADGKTKFTWDGMDNSTPTTAGGSAFSQGANAVTGGVATDALAAGASSLFRKGASAGTSKVLLPGAATVGSQVASKPSTPAKP